MKKIISIFSLIVLAFVLASCDIFRTQENITTNAPVTTTIKANTTTVKPNTTITTTKEITTVTTFKTDNRSIKVSDTYYDLFVGESMVIFYQTEGFNLGADESIKFNSSDTDVVTVLQNGRVKAVGIGTAVITLYYSADMSVYRQVTFNITAKIEIYAPAKTEYIEGENLDLTGGYIQLYDEDGNPSTKIALTEEMVTGFDNSKLGLQELTISYYDKTLVYTINVSELEDKDLLVDSVTQLNTAFTGEKVSFKINHKDIAKLKKKLNSVFDYDEYYILFEFISPSGEESNIYAYFNQDYTETKTTTVISTSLKFEGYTNPNKVGYNFNLSLKLNGNAYYKVNFNPSESGEYIYNAYVYYCDQLIDTEEGKFEVVKKANNGVLKVASNKRNFEFENGKTFIPVGENVAWYTSKQRRYYDYEMIFNQLGENNANFARVWLAGWGFSLFWDNIYDYSSRLDEAYELDKVFELAEDNGIYIQLTLLHHGMFSKEVNPMWPGASNDWYNSQYGSNPYAKLINEPGEFFTNDLAIKNFKNFLQYIISRYGYSNNLMSYEIFNEVDWVESYTAEQGKKWHDDIAKFIKGLDEYNHMVTTSVKGDSFNSNIYTVFSLNSIDYVNVHSYGNYNYLSYIPGKANTGFNKFNKPIFYTEVGYSGNGGSDQMEKDPDNITLHQELYAGMMSSAGAGMNWWWDSWIEPGNAYSYYKGPGILANKINLNASNVSMINDSQGMFNRVNILGYNAQNRAYVYVYNSNYSLGSYNMNSKSYSFDISGLDSGKYTVNIYNTFTGELVSSSSKNVLSNSLSITLTMNDDAFVEVIHD